MESSMEGGSKATLSAESISALYEGISLLLSGWTALQMAIQNEWGGRDSRQKSIQLASDLLSWFAHSKGPLYIDDLENMLDETMVLSFNTEIEDGSIEEIAEQLMVMHEECLQGNYESIEKLRICNEGTQAVCQSKQVINDDEDESSDDEALGMAVDEPKPEPKDMATDVLKPKELIESQVINDDEDESSDDEVSGMAVDEPKPEPKDMATDVLKPKELMDAEEGWTVVPTRRNRGKRAC